MTGTDRTRIFSHITQTRFLHIEDSLERRKLRFFIGEYVRGQGSKGFAFAFLDLDEARVVLSDLSWGKPTDYISRTGSKDDGGVITSRVLKIKLKDDKCWIEIQNGPGAMVGPGAVKPNGKPTADISIALSVFDARKMAHACLAYIQVWELKNSIQRSAVSD